jgi:hypothetical protein
MQFAESRLLIDMDYFVSYRIPNCYGRCLVTRKTPITCIEDIVEMEAAILKMKEDRGEPMQAGEKPVIVNWQKFEKPE